MTSDPRETDPPAEGLESFGLDSGGDRWLEVFAEALDDEPVARLGAYEILGEAGRGGQGVVLKARCSRTGRTVALKRMHTVQTAETPGASRELAAAAALDHPAIVGVRAAMEQSEPSLLEMDWVEGVPFTRWSDAHLAQAGERGAGLREVLTVFVDVCDAVRHAHQRGIIHRDLKPTNILIEHHGGTLRPRLLDFGLALRVEGGAPRTATETTCTGQLVGTLAYIAPELLSAGPSAADARADVYSLGVLLYRAITGRVPYETDVPIVEALRRVQEQEPAAPSLRAGPGDGELDAVVLTALAKAPSRRYQSVDALGADIRRWLVGLPVSARTPGAFDRTWHWARRHRVAAATAAAALLLAAWGGVVSTILAVKLERRRAEAEVARELEAGARADAERATAFLRDTLAAARPSARGPNAGVLDILHDAALRAETELEGQPRVAAEVLYTVGFTLRSLWRFADAVPPLERALELSMVEFGEESEQTARCLVALGTCQSNTLNPAASKTQERGLQIRRALAVGDDPLVAESLMRLGYALYRSPPTPGQADFAGAGARLEEALAMYRRLYGDAHRDVGSCLHNIAYMQVHRRDDAAAARVFAEAVGVFRAAGAVRDPYYAECLTGYAPVLQRQGRKPEALAITLELVPLAYDLYGSEIGDSQVMRAAGLRLELGDAAGAAELLEPLAGGLARARTPAEGPAATAAQAHAASRLAVCWWQQGRKAEATALMSVAREVLQETVGADHVLSRQAELWWGAREPDGQAPPKQP